VTDDTSAMSDENVPDGAERRLHDRDSGAGDAPVIDLGFGPVEVLDWSFGGARLGNINLPLTVGEFATGTIRFGTISGSFIADVVRVHPPYFDPPRTPDEISLRWLDLPEGLLEQMIDARAASGA